MRTVGNRWTSGVHLTAVPTLFPMNSDAWKDFERKCAKEFGGRRTPLSGLNSGHGTSSDVIGIPDWMYVECKRNKVYNKWIEEYRELLFKSKVSLCFNTPFGYVALFELRNYISKRGDVPCVDAAKDYSGFKRIPAALSLLEKTIPIAKSEGRRVTLCCFKLHSKQGIYTLAKVEQLAKGDWSQWLRTRDVLKMP